jgi:hypothetical protein
LFFGRINLEKVRRLLRLTMCHYARLLTVSLMLVAIGGAAFAAPLAHELRRQAGEDAFAAYRGGDYATALRLWHPLAEQGDAEAQFHLGVLYESGQGVLRNGAEAIKWYRKAAEQGDAVAQFNLGIIYANGEGVAQNDGEAAHWYWLAADQGLAGAQFNFGMMYAEGKGVPQDYVQAYMWLNQAASQLPALGKGQRNTTVDDRNVVASKMTPMQVTEAQKLALEWMAERRYERRLRALLEALPFKLGKEGPERVASVPDLVQAHSGDLQDSPVQYSAGLPRIALGESASAFWQLAAPSQPPTAKRTSGLGRVSAERRSEAGYVVADCSGPNCTNHLPKGRAIRSLLGTCSCPGSARCGCPNTEWPRTAVASVCASGGPRTAR